MHTNVSKSSSSNSVKVCLNLSMCFVGLYPKRMYINRGNHEAKEMNRTYGFEGEAKHKHGEQTYKVSVQPLNYLILY